MWTLQTFLRRLIWACMAPLLALALVAMAVQLRDSQSQRDADLDLDARLTQQSLENPLGAVVQGLRMLAASPHLEAPGVEPGFYAQAQAFRSSFGAHVVLAHQGHMLMNTRLPLDAPLPPMPQISGRAAVSAALASGRPAVGDLFEGPVSQTPLVAVAVPLATPQRAGQALLAIVEAAQVERHLRALPLSDGVHAVLLDSTGRPIARRGHIDLSATPPPRLWHSCGRAAGHRALVARGRKRRRGTPGDVFQECSGLDDRPRAGGFDRVPGGPSRQRAPGTRFPVPEPGHLRRPTPARDRGDLTGPATLAAAASPTGTANRRTARERTPRLGAAEADARARHGDARRDDRVRQPKRQRTGRRRRQSAAQPAVNGFLAPPRPSAGGANAGPIAAAHRRDGLNAGAHRAVRRQHPQCGRHHRSLRAGRWPQNDHRRPRRHGGKGRPAGSGALSRRAARVAEAHRRGAGDGAPTHRTGPARRPAADPGQHHAVGHRPGPVRWPSATGAAARTGPPPRAGGCSGGAVHPAHRGRPAAAGAGSVGA